MAPDWALPLKLKVSKPVRGFDHHGPHTRPLPKRVGLHPSYEGFGFVASASSLRQHAKEKLDKLRSSVTRGAVLMAKPATVLEIWGDSAANRDRCRSRAIFDRRKTGATSQGRLLLLQVHRTCRMRTLRCTEHSDPATRVRVLSASTPAHVSSPRAL